MKLTILGAGLSGLSLAYFLQDRSDIEHIDIIDLSGDNFAFMNPEKDIIFHRNIIKLILCYNRLEEKIKMISKAKPTITRRLPMENGFFQVQDLRVGMKATADQLSHIMNKYMILAYDHEDDVEGTLVFIGNRQNKEYNKWFMQDKMPITPIHHTPIELEEN